MSEKLPQEPQNEEVDLGQLFNAIGKLFEKLFSFIGNVLKGIFSAIIFSLKPIVNNFKLVAIILMTSALIGFGVEKLKAPVYVSNMLVRPYYDSKYQLANNVDYFNALIGSENYQELSNIFEIDSSTVAKELVGFEIEIGPETQNDLIKEYDDYIKSLDSTLAVEVTYEDFIENRDILAGSIFSIKAKATDNGVFTSLEQGFIKTFENEYSKKFKAREDSIRKVKKLNYLQELARIEKLQNTYLEIKTNESNKGEFKFGTDGLIPLIQEKTETKEYELFQEELKIRSALRALEEETLETSEYYDILSSFEDVGTIESNIFERFSLVFPAVSLLIMIITYLVVRIFKFIKEYE
ncbi:hypothetical protein [Winogradskyella aquimaris]|uniref:Chain length determinant protein n=1 Tax=Winogradskyella aquimaris TaxID=864074 RepID=A0ABU5EJG5_9FLAO|nr:hypothetical protein [Winogradskyella aquimaris]MDY2586494.1 hypothetical protein [Winogradskyella aquimaris]